VAAYLRGTASVSRATGIAAFALALATGRVEGQALFRGGVEAVRLDVSVTRGGRPVQGLQAADFTVLDNGVRQKVADVTLEANPLSVLVVLDTSGSVQGGKLQSLLDAVRGLLASLRPDDAAALITFSEDVRLVVPLTSDRGKLTSALVGLEAGGATAMHDAVWTALHLKPDDDSRPLVLLFSDGLDTASWLSSSDVRQSAERAGIVLHAVELTQPAPVVADPFRRDRLRPQLLPQTFVELLAQATGGRRWSATAPNELRQLFARAIDEMRARYLVTFYPEGPRTPGWHKLEVSARGRGDVTARPGYFVTPD
jgi:Ca-activated chloride channel family protein